MGWVGGGVGGGWCGEMEIKANLSQSLVEVEAELGNKTARGNFFSTVPYILVEAQLFSTYVLQF